MNNILVTLLVSSLLAGCTGKIMYREAGKNLDDGIEGIPFRIAESWEEYFTYTTIEKGGAISTDCRWQARTRVLDNVPSSDRHIIAYKPRWFEKHKFAVALHANGTLASMSVESTPVSPKELAEVAQIVAGLPMFLPTPEAVSQQEKAGFLESPPRPCTGTPQSLGRCKIGDEKCADKVRSRIRNLIFPNEKSAAEFAVRQALLERQIKELQQQLEELQRQLEPES